MNRINIIGIGFRPLEKKAKEAVLKSDVVLVNERLLETFKDYDEYEAARGKIKVLKDIYETKAYIRDNYNNQTIALIAVGDPMFFGIGRVIVEEFGKDTMEVYPDLSSVQVAFSRIKEPSSNAFFMSLHGGPDPKKRRKLEYEITELPGLLQQHGKIAILTDRVNTPQTIAEELLKLPASSRDEVTSPLHDVRMYVCEKLGYFDEKITEGTPEEIAEISFEHPNVVIIIKTK